MRGRAIGAPAVVLRQGDVPLRPSRRAITVPSYRRCAAIEGQRNAREALAWQRQREGAALADLKAERATLGAKGGRWKQRAHPIRYIAELVGADADSERIIRWLIALMVLCFDPLAIALTAAASARRQT